MTWNILNQEISRYTQRKERLEQIADIVARHPEWLKTEPRLAELLQAVKSA